MDKTLERETCGRCGGSGRYSYNQMDGDRCYGCGGKGIRLTKRGKAANAYLLALRSKPASELRVGDVVRGDNVSLDGRRIMYRWERIISIDPDTSSPSDQTPKLRIETDHCLHLGVAPDYPYRVRQTPEQERATLEQAIEYQATLTKSGAPRKSREVA